MFSASPILPSTECLSFWSAGCLPCLVTSLACRDGREGTTFSHLVARSSLERPWRLLLHTCSRLQPHPHPCALRAAPPAIPSCRASSAQGPGKLPEWERLLPLARGAAGCWRPGRQPPPPAAPQPSPLFRWALKTQGFSEQFRISRRRTTASRRRRAYREGQRRGVLEPSWEGPALSKPWAARRAAESWAEQGG